MPKTISGEVLTVRKFLSEHAKSHLRAPAYQRPYVWDAGDIDQLVRDAETLSKGTQHFLGTIVRSEVKSTPSVPEYLIVDGQQRLTTIMLLLLVAASHNDKNAKRVQELVSLATFELHGGSQLRWRPTHLDTAQIDAVIEDLEGESSFGISRLSGVAGSSRGPLYSAYVTIWDWAVEHGAAAIYDLVSHVLDRCVVSIITVPKGIDATQTFQSINATGKGLDASDLIRNLVFQKFGTDEVAAEAFFVGEWADLERPLKKGQQFADFLHNFASMHAPSVTKSGLFKHLAERWESKDPAYIHQELSPHQQNFLVLAGLAEVDPATTPNEYREALLRIQRVDGAKNAWPYLLQLMHEVEGAPARVRRDAAKCVRAIEATLVRRALVGTQNTGIRYFFTGLYDKVGVDPKALRARIYAERSGDLRGPTDKEIRDHIQTAPMYNKTVTRAALYVLETHERLADSLRTKTYRELKAIKVSVDHVMPQQLASGWRVTERSRLRTVNLLGNLVLISSARNSSKGQQSWAKAKSGYKAERDLLRPREIADRYPKWGPTQIDERTRELGKFILSANGWPSLSG